jgi:cyanophycinase
MKRISHFFLKIGTIALILTNTVKYDCLSTQVIKLSNSSALIGMGFLPGVAIDQHFAQRGRLGRLISALTQQPAVLGFGIDENTAIAVKEDEIEVIGEGAITIID